MCGIFGIWHRDGKPVDLTAVQIATNRLRHRGPDDEGYLLASPSSGECRAYSGAETDPRLALPPLDQARGTSHSLAFGFRRLAILDLSPAGHQPMASADGRFWIVFNGEIYNYIELRDELRRCGHVFRSDGDTEVILASYAQWGESCLERFNGIWAFAIWDREKRELFLARDRFGVKPLYYVAIGQTFAFASEIKALVGKHILPFTPEPFAIYRFLVDGSLPDPQRGATFFVGVRSLPPGHCMRIADGSSVMPRCYYDVPLSDDRHHAQAPETIIAAYRDLFIDAVRLELRSDVTVGTCLSGGIDSSSIVCAVNRLISQEGLSAAQIGERQKTFSVVYDSEGRYNERRHIERVLRATTADGHFVIPTVKRLLADIERLVWHQDEPFQSTSIFAQWCVMSLVREHNVTVLLDGQGADELLAGYRPYARYLGDLLRKGHSATFLAEMVAIIARSDAPIAPLLRTTLIFSFPTSVLKLVGSARQFLRARPIALHPDFTNTYRQAYLMDTPYWSGEETLDHHLRNALTARSLPHLLRYEDRNSMAFSIEARVPFLDHRLVEFVFQYAPHLRIREGWTKWVHRRAMEGLLPDAIAWRSDKVGFETPEDAWQRNLLAARPDLFADGAACSTYLDLPVVRRVVAQWLARGGDTRQIWRWISLEIWLQVYKDLSDDV